MRRALKITAAILASAALIGSSTAAAAAAPAALPQQVSPWAILAASSGGAPAAAICGAGAAVATQVPGGCVLPSVDAAPVPQPLGTTAPLPYAGVAPGAAGITGELLPFLLWFGLIGIALSLDSGSGRPNSPP